VRVRFLSGIKVWVDVAPIIKEDYPEAHRERGWIPRKDKWGVTMDLPQRFRVSEQRPCRQGGRGPVHFNRLVRMMKWWNNLQGDLVQPSIFCELITAAASRTTGVTSAWHRAAADFQLLRATLRQADRLRHLLHSETVVLAA